MSNIISKEAVLTVLNDIKNKELNRTLRSQILSKIYRHFVDGFLNLRIAYYDENICIVDAYSWEQPVKQRYTLNTSQLIGSKLYGAELFEVAKISLEEISLFDVENLSKDDVEAYYRGNYFQDSVNDEKTYNFQVTTYDSYLRFDYNQESKIFDKNGEGNFEVNGSLWKKGFVKPIITPYILFTDAKEILNYKSKVSDFVSSHKKNLEAFEILQDRMKAIQKKLSSDKEALKQIIESSGVKELTYIEGDLAQTVSVVYYDNTYDVQFESKKIIN